MKLIFTIFLNVILGISLCKAEKPEIVDEPVIGMKGSDYHDEGMRFFRLLEKYAGFPEKNEREKNTVTSYISSGAAGHSITIYRITDKLKQDEIFEIAQRIVNEGNYKFVYIQFLEAERWIDLGNGVSERKGEKKIRSKILTKKTRPNQPVEPRRETRLAHRGRSK